MDSAYSASLSAKHAQLDTLISDEVKRPMPDASLLARLKRQKLRIKEQLFKR